MAREAAYWLVGFVWLSAIAGGLWAWGRYDATPGAAARPAVAAEEAAGRWQLTVFAHPRCPCTRAALDEAGGIASAAPELGVRVLFVRPPGARGNWEAGESWARAARIPGAAVALDEDGVQARRSGARTSGQAVLADPSGRVVFRGGLTAARGRGGENFGRRSILDWVGGRAGAADAPVYGCPLFAADE